MRRLLAKLLAAGLILGLAGCFSLPSVEEQTAALAKEPFSSECRLAVGSAQWKPIIPSSGVASSLVEGMVNLAFNAAFLAAVDKAQFGAAPIDQFDQALRDLLAAQLPAKAEMLERAAYSADVLAKKDNVYLAHAAAVARQGGYDGLVFVYLEPWLDLASGLSKYRVRFKTQTVIRSLRNDAILHRQRPYFQPRSRS